MTKLCLTVLVLVAVSACHRSHPAVMQAPPKALEPKVLYDTLDNPCSPMHNPAGPRIVPRLLPISVREGKRESIAAGSAGTLVFRVQAAEDTTRLEDARVLLTDAWGRVAAAATRENGIAEFRVDSLGGVTGGNRVSGGRYQLRAVSIGREQRRDSLVVHVGHADTAIIHMRRAVMCLY